MSEKHPPEFWPRLWVRKILYTRYDTTIEHTRYSVAIRQQPGDVEFVCAPEVEHLLREARMAGIQFAIERPVEALEEMTEEREAREERDAMGTR